MRTAHVCTVKEIFDFLVVNGSFCFMIIIHFIIPIIHAYLIFKVTSFFS